MDKLQFLGLLLATAAALQADTTFALTETQKLVPSNPYMGGDQWGNAVALSGGTALVAAYQDNLGAGTGSVAVFSDTGANWQETARLQRPSQPGQFGYDVDLSGDKALVGARFAQDSGRAFVYEKSSSSSWVSVDTLSGSSSPTGQFGSSVSIDGMTALVGSQEGIAYVFEEDSSGDWKQAAQLIPSDMIFPNSLNVSVSVFGNTALVGYPNAGNATYVFRKDGTGSWNEIAIFTASDADAFGNFGGSVALHGNTAIIGAPGLFSDSAPPGAAYIFQEDGSGNWSEVAKLAVANGFNDSVFGYSVALDANVAIVGDPGDDDAGSGGGTDPGAAYVYYRDEIAGWQLRHELTASDAAPGDGFGRTVAVSGNTFLVGAQFNDDNGSASGSAYLFVIPEPHSLILILAVGACLSMYRYSVLGTSDGTVY